MSLLRDVAAASGRHRPHPAVYNQPASWHGVPNPLLGCQALPAPNNLYFAKIAPTARCPISTTTSRPSGAATSNAAPAGSRRILARWGSAAPKPPKSSTASTGVPGPARRAVRRDGRRKHLCASQFVVFFKALAAEGFGQARPALAFHALYAGDQIVATRSAPTRARITRSTSIRRRAGRRQNSA